MYKVQLPGSVRFDSQIKIHTGTENKDVSLAQESKIICKKSTAKMLSLIKEIKEMIHGNKMDRKKDQVQDNAAVELKDVKMNCNTNQFP